MDCRRKEREKHVVDRVGLNGLFSQEKEQENRATSTETLLRRVNQSDTTVVLTRDHWI